MRSSLLGGLLQALKHNLAHKSQRVRLFEVGRVFVRDASVADSAFSVAGIDQPLRLAALAYGPAEAVQWGATTRNVDFFDMKGDLQALLNRVQATFEPAGHGDCPEHTALHPGRSARIRVGNQVVGWIGELHPRCKQAYDLPQAPLLLELALDAVLHDTVAQYQQVLRQQPVWRDLALVVPENVNYQMLKDAISQSPCSFMRGTELFDVYKPKLGVASDLASGERSLAVRTEWLDPSAPLTDERVDEQIALLLQHLSQTLNIRLRG
jgi:phenylalanyl-tRNA synthetase beta chain